jgi:pyridoxal biosynthesis lyase PdxS
MGRTFFEAGRLVEAERCLNNASEHFVKLGQPQGEAAVLRLLADLYEHRRDSLSAIRSLERLMVVLQSFGETPTSADQDRLMRLRKTGG